MQADKISSFRTQIFACISPP